jgi:hypothetical protein
LDQEDTREHGRDDRVYNDLKYLVVGHVIDRAI